MCLMATIGGPPLNLMLPVDQIQNAYLGLFIDRRSNQKFCFGYQAKDR